MKCEYRPAGFWWGATPKDYWPQDKDMIESIMKHWEERMAIEDRISFYRSKFIKRHYDCSFR